MDKNAGHPWYATLSRKWSWTLVCFAAITFYCFILGTGVWIATSQYSHARVRALFVIFITLLGTALWTRVVIGMVSALRRAALQGRG